MLRRLVEAGTRIAQMGYASEGEVTDLVNMAQSEIYNVNSGTDTEDYVPFAMTLDRAAHTCGVNFIGGYSALVQKGFSKGDELLLRSIPQALAQTELVCSSVNVGSTKAGINMDTYKYYIDFASRNGL